MIPTIILTTSDAESDILKGYQLQANCYLVKPVSFDEFASLIRTITNFWLARVRLPQRTAGSQMLRQEASYRLEASSPAATGAA